MFSVTFATNDQGTAIYPNNLILQVQKLSKVIPILISHSLGLQSSAMRQGSNGGGQGQGPSTPWPQVTASGPASISPHRATPSMEVLRCLVLGIEYPQGSSFLTCLHSKIPTFGLNTRRKEKKNILNKSKLGTKEKGKIKVTNAGGREPFSITEAQDFQGQVTRHTCGSQ